MSIIGSACACESVVAQPGNAMPTSARLEVARKSRREKPFADWSLWRLHCLMAVSLSLRPANFKW